MNVLLCFNIFIFVTVWRIASISNQGEGSALLGTSAFIYMHTLMEQRQTWGHHFVSDGIMLMVILMFFRWVNFGCRANGLVDLKKKRYDFYILYFVGQEVLLFMVGCFLTVYVTVWYGILEDGEVKLVLYERVMLGCVVANNIALLEMSFWLLCVMLKISLQSCSLIELLKFLSKMYLQYLVRWSCHCKVWDSNNCVDDFSHLLGCDTMSFAK